MHNEFTAIIERDGTWFTAQCPEGYLVAQPNPTILFRDQQAAQVPALAFNFSFSSAEDSQ